MDINQLWVRFDELCRQRIYSRVSRGLPLAFIRKALRCADHLLGLIRLQARVSISLGNRSSDAHAHLVDYVDDRLVMREQELTFGTYLGTHLSTELARRAYRAEILVCLHVLEIGRCFNDAR